MGLSGRGKRTGGKKATGTRKPRAKAVKKNAVRKAATKKTVARNTQKKPQQKKEGGAWAAVFTPRAPGERRYWLVKSEPETFSFDDLMSAPGRITHWDGVRNFAARNFMRDGMNVGDQVFFYHSSVNPQAIVGICEVVREAYPDSTAFDSSHHGYDADSDPNDPTWVMVDLRAVERLARPVTLPELKAEPRLAGMALLRIGRLSVTPVTATEWEVIRGLAASG
jgi:predicted RNA-binding protein with PUA-like domain